MELGGRHYKWHRCSMEFHGIFHWIPWNSGAAKWHITLFHGIPLNISWNSIELWCRQMTYHLVPWNIPWNSMELWCRQMTYHLVPWNSMELWHCLFVAFYPGWTSKWYSMEFQGISGDCHFIQCHATRCFHWIYHGIPFQITQVFHGIPWNIPWNSMELMCRQMKYQLVP